MNVVVLCGGVGGARMARALAATVASDRLTVVVNVGDDDYMYGAHVAADLDTVVYTLAGVEGPQGWGIADDTFTVMDHLEAGGVNTGFRLGDRDLATCLTRTQALRNGLRLSAITTQLARSFGIKARVTPVTDDPLQTKVKIGDDRWLSFQDYFVTRGHRDRVLALEYDGAEACVAAPGVIDAIDNADLLVIAPSNPPLSIWPILAVPGTMEAVAGVNKVVAVSPLFGGQALKGPAAEVLTSLGLPPGTEGILAAYNGLLSTLVVDEGDADDVRLSDDHTQVISTDTRIADAASGRAFANWLLDTMMS